MAEGDKVARRGLAARAAIALVRTYQLTLASLFTGSCRFEPSCSAYAIESLERHGAVRGLGLTVRRLARCQPFGPAGFDPVPPRRTSDR